MNNRLLFSFLVLALIGAVAIAMTTKNFQVLQPSTVAEAKARAQSPLPMCLQENKDVKEVEPLDQNNIVNTLTAQLIDVPAGTNADVYFSTFDKKTATGTVVYGGEYGSYNFTIKKDAASKWNITSFDQCSG